MSPPVFISYARKTSLAWAQALHHALGGPGGQSFLDTTDIDVEEHFPRQLVEALLAARVVVLFVDEAYFQSWYCQWELRAALAPLLALAPGASEEEKKSNLASTLHQLGDASGARAIHEQVLSARRKVLGDNHPATLETRLSLAETLKLQGELLEARKQGELAHAGLARALGEEHLQTLQAAHNLAGTLMRMQDLPAARGLMERLVATYRRLLGEHPKLFMTQNNLAEVMRQLGDAPRAMALQQEAIGGFQRLLGERHPLTLSAMCNLASMLGDQGDWDGARRKLQEALAAAHATYGNEHLLTTQIAWALMQALFKLRDVARGRKIFERHLEWLLARAPETLLAFQQHVREQLIMLYQS